MRACIPQKRASNSMRSVILCCMLFSNRNLPFHNMMANFLIVGCCSFLFIICFSFASSSSPISSLSLSFFLSLLLLLLCLFFTPLVPHSFSTSSCESSHTSLQQRKQLYFRFQNPTHHANQTPTVCLNN